ncbi:MAG TPA: hypothetical protein VGM33_23675, partial [Baekduia sp.]
AFTVPASGAQCRLDAGPWIPCASPYRLNGVAAGDHVLSVRSVDAAGNAGATPTSTRFQINPNAPVVSLRNPAIIRVPASGLVALRLLCPATEGAGHGACDGTVALRFAGRTVGRATFHAAAGKTATTRVKLTASALRRVRSKHGVRAAIALSVKDLAGNRRATTVARVLRAGRR